MSGAHLPVRGVNPPRSLNPWYRLGFRAQRPNLRDTTLGMPALEESLSAEGSEAIRAHGIEQAWKSYPNAGR